MIWWATWAMAGSRALLIEAGTGQPEGSAWHGADLSGAVPQLREALTRRGVTDVTVRAGDAADRAGILGALDDLHDASGPGDVVVVYYTGHGAQLSDDDGDEPDGLDEAWVTVGAADVLDPRHPDAELGVIRDDELGAHLDALSRRVGPTGHVLWMVDACHSGTGARGAAADALVGRTFGAASGAESGSGWAGALPDNAVVLSAARHDQAASWLSDQAAGVLTAVVAPMIAEASADESYRALALRARHELQRAGHDQQPQVEGAAGRTVLSGQGAQHPYFEVAGPVVDDAGPHVQLRGGTLSGLTEGAKVALVPAGTRRLPADPLARGEVVVAGPAASEVRLDRPVPDGDTWALVTEVGRAPTLRWVLDPAADKIADDLRTHLGAVPGLVEADEGPWTLTVDGKGRDRRVVAVHTEGTRLDGPQLKSPDAASWAQLATALQQAVGFRSLRDVTLSDDAYEVRIRLREPIVERTADRCTVTDVARPRLDDDQRPWTVGDAAVVEVLFEGEQDAHLTVVVFTPEGDAVRLFPPAGASEEGGELPALGAFLVDPSECRAFDAPGTYVFKAWATATPLHTDWLVPLDDALSGRGRTLPDVHALVGHTAVQVVQVGDRR